VSQFFDSFLVLAMAHFVCDFVLQNDRMAVEKVKGHDITLNWRYWLTAHAAAHGFAVALITGLPSLGLLEWVSHFMIDYIKGKERISLFQDQGLHIACKAAWALMIVQ